LGEHALKIGFDIDGVLANFNRGYIQLLADLGGLELDPEYAPQRWHYEADLGVSKAVVNKAWDTIRESDTFWVDLDPYDVLLEELEDHDLYFITTRVGNKVKRQTEVWLYGYQHLQCPTVLISANKGPVAAGLELDVFIDDKLENILDVEAASPKTRTYLLNQAYNQHGEVKCRVDTVQEMLKLEGL
jgi:hypothetical protein